MPQEVLTEAAAEMLDWHGSGMSVMEMSHRGREFVSIYEQAQLDLRELLAVPDSFKILFMQGGGLAENAIVPLNLSARVSPPGAAGSADFVVTGGWSLKSQQEARKYCTVNIAASNESDGHTTLPEPASWQLSHGASYVHICSNETIHGVEYHTLPCRRWAVTPRWWSTVLPTWHRARSIGRGSDWPLRVRRRTWGLPV